MSDKKLCLDVLHVFLFVGSMAELIYVRKRYVQGFLGKPASPPLAFLFDAGEDYDVVFFS